MKSVLAIVLVILGLLVLGERIGFVGFHYPRWLENEPLRDPIGIAKVEGNMVTLEDGRVLELEMDPSEGDWEDFFASRKRIDIEYDGAGDALIYATMPQLRCGTPWAKPIRIPLIPDNAYSNRRQMIAFGSFEESANEPDPADGNKMLD